MLSADKRNSLLHVIPEELIMMTYHKTCTDLLNMLNIIGFLHVSYIYVGLHIQYNVMYFHLIF